MTTKNQILSILAESTARADAHTEDCFSHTHDSNGACDCGLVSRELRHIPTRDAALRVAVEALSQIAGPSPGKPPPGVAEGLAVAHEMSAEKGLARILEILQQKP